MKTGMKLLITALLLAALSACVEREEKIKVAEDGSVSHSVVFKADSWDELHDGMIPCEAEGWQIVTKEIMGNDDKVKYELKATRTFAPGAKLPETFAAASDPEQDLYLAFPTTVRLEKAGNVTHCHFQRIFQERPWAYVSRLKKMVGSDRLEKLEKRKPAELNQKERIELIQYLARFECLKRLCFARRAFKEVTPEGKQAGWLRIHGSVMKLTKKLDLDKIASLMALESDQGDQAIAVEAHRFEEGMNALILKGLEQECAYTQEMLLRFTERFKRQEKLYQITEDLQYEGFTIRVEMPGEIMGSNAHKVEGNTAVWEFNGEALLDSDLELLVSSRF